MTDPTLFANGTISTDKIQEFGGVFTKDGNTFYFNHYDPQKDPAMTSYQSKYVDGHWSEPERLAFLPDNVNTSVDSISKDGTKMFLTMNRNKEGIRSEDLNVWIAEKSGEDWGNLRFVEELNSNSHDGNAKWTNKGKVYMLSDRAGSIDIYSVELTDGKFESPQAMNFNKVTDSLVFSDVYVEPDEKFMLISMGYLNSNPFNTDIYVSYKEEGGWTAMEKINNAKINTPDIEELPFVSPDGNYVFFTRQAQRGFDIYQVDRSAFLLK